MALFRPAKAPIRGAVVLVTGAGSGIGELMAVGAAQRGAKAVCVWDVDAAAASRVAHEIERRGGTARAWRVDVADGHCVDVADGHCVDAAAASVLAAFGRVDVLVNNAGIVTGKRFAEMTEDDVERTFQVNVFSLYRTVRRFLPGMVERDRGSIVTIASAAGLVGVARQADYSASKFAAVGFTESLRSELRHSGSHVHTLVVAPYYIDTGMFDGVRTRVPLLLPILKPAKVADAVLDSVERGDQRRVLPRFANAVLTLKALPVPLLDAVTEAFGVSSTMDGFTGRRRGGRAAGGEEPRRSEKAS